MCLSLSLYNGFRFAQPRSIRNEIGFRFVRFEMQVVQWFASELAFDLVNLNLLIYPTDVRIVGWSVTSEATREATATAAAC
jgi:hypothetical protein